MLLLLWLEVIINQNTHLSVWLNQRNHTYHHISRNNKVIFLFLAKIKVLCTRIYRKMRRKECNIFIWRDIDDWGNILNIEYNTDWYSIVSPQIQTRWGGNPTIKVWTGSIASSLVSDTKSTAASFPNSMSPTSSSRLSDSGKPWLQKKNKHSEPTILGATISLLIKKSRIRTTAPSRRLLSSPQS